MSANNNIVKSSDDERQGTGETRNSVGEKTAQSRFSSDSEGKSASDSDDDKSDTGSFSCSDENNSRDPETEEKWASSVSFFDGLDFQDNNSVSSEELDDINENL